MTATDDETALATRQPDLIQLAIEKGMDADSLGKLFDLLERKEKNEAQRRFGDALALFQKKCPTVFKAKTAKIKTKSGSEFSYNFASLDDVMAEASPILAECGISVSFDTEHSVANMLTVVCRLRVGGYFEDRKFTAPVPSDMAANEPQKFGSALSFLKRYALCAALNIVVTNDVDDDAGRCFEFITKGEVATLKELLDEKGADFERFLKWAGIESLDRMPAKQLPKALDMLHRKQKAGAA